MALVWRLLVDPAPADGVWNMAVDRAIQQAREAGSVPPTVRLYEWARPTLSLGRFQALDGIDLDTCRDRGIDVVHRATGGRGVLHDDEVTYSVVASLQDGIPRGVAASYRYLCAGLEHAYRLLGVEARLTERPRGDGGSAACYLHATPADLSLGARKLSGSAQVWLGSTVLQHGSFTISRDVRREGEVFRLSDEARRALAATTWTLADRPAGPPSREEIRSAIRRGFEVGLGITLQEGRLTEREDAEARRLHEQAVCGDLEQELATGADLGLE